MTSPYCSTSRRTLRPPRVRPISRSSAPTLPKNAPGRNGRRSSRAAGSAVASDDRSRSDASTNRPTVRSCRSASNDPNPAASHRSDTDAAASPRSRASGPSSGDTAPVSNAQRASPSASPSGASASLASTHRPNAAPRGRSAARSAAVAAQVRSNPRPRANRASSVRRPAGMRDGRGHGPAGRVQGPVLGRAQWRTEPSRGLDPVREVRRQPGQQVAVALDRGYRVRHRLPAGLRQDVDRRVEGARSPAAGARTGRCRRPAGGPGRPPRRPPAASSGRPRPRAAGAPGPAPPRAPAGPCDR